MKILERYLLQRYNLLWDRILAKDVHETSQFLFFVKANS